jgi:hypothetical protein
MYNFSGIIYRLWAVDGILFLLGIICILIEKPWSENFKFKKIIIGLVIIAFSISVATVHIVKIVSPDVSSYTGEFVSSNRNSRVAPPLPLTIEYRFWNGEGKKQCFYLDAFSKKELFPIDFEKGEEYTIYYDDFTNVIVKVEVLE